MAYGKDYFGGDVYADYLDDLPGRMSAARMRLRRIESLHPSRGALLDYGSAVGVFVKAAMERGWAAVGYERSAWAVEYGRSVLKVPIVLGDGRDAPFGEASFDVVTAWDVLEHLTSPSVIVGKIAGWLKPGGILAISTVDASSVGARLAGRNWRHLGPPWHLQYFSRYSLRRLLESNRLEIVCRSAEGSLLRSGVKAGGWRIGRVVDGIARYWRWRGLVARAGLLDEQLVWARRWA